MADLKDSGERTTFDSGAMREVLEDKGRCDLLPFEEIGKFFERLSMEWQAFIFFRFHEYIYHGNPAALYCILDCFVCHAYREDHSTVGAYTTAILELAKHYQDGTKKYADRNWEKGLPLHSFIDSGARHFLKYLRGDKDEPHDRAFMWNIFGAIWTQTNRPRCIDLPFKDKYTQVNPTQCPANMMPPLKLSKSTKALDAVDAIAGVANMIPKMTYEVDTKDLVHCNPGNPVNGGTLDLSDHTNSGLTRTGRAPGEEAVSYAKGDKDIKGGVTEYYFNIVTKQDPNRLLKEIEDLLAQKERCVTYPTGKKG